MATTIKTILTVLVPDLAGAAAGGTSTGGAADNATGVPHAVQDCAPTESSAPHFEQMLATIISLKLDVFQEAAFLVPGDMPLYSTAFGQVAQDFRFLIAPIATASRPAGS
jgi:hypothetical protein